ncbi:AraC family transcriptional regulator [Streptomyces sp. WAC05374]|uniref:AraC family transcriptional regulator n=1 Tax=unclassified Streptomyces TaxID=2593676 RepID=UPI000F882980|nr:AraC family transcriptional regulator [Streptomyces sp. WAC05374]RST12026.1 AraC family transcriptional regulator [Streptomyces sp. WAC05374]TDF54619.1 AraC family transcriptional regulator [Streptomyces sp. WAC05374]TDF56254.1 AraC family transcriptional regulator [Streptomyces sp. WAC05374]
MHEGTISAPLARFVTASVRASGAPMRRFERFPDLGPEVLGDDLARISTPSALALWEQLTLTEPGSSIGALMTQGTPLGTFGLWDYLISTGDNLAGSLKVAIGHLACIGDPAAEKLRVIEDGRTFTIRHSTGAWVPDVVEAINLFALAMFSTRARAATQRPVTPLEITLTHRPPRTYQRLAEFFGTRNIVFDAPYNSITFADNDVRAPLPKAMPGLQQVLTEHAVLTLAAAKPVLRWHDRFRAILDAALREDAASLDEVAQRLAMSPRTLQRRLAEHDTSWREELEHARHQHAVELLRGTDLPLNAIATRVGFSDARALRRAVRRWEGRSPNLVRRDRVTVGGPTEA